MFNINNTATGLATTVNDSVVAWTDVCQTLATRFCDFRYWSCLSWLQTVLLTPDNPQTGFRPSCVKSK